MCRKVAIMVATHKAYDFPNDKGYLPIYVGAAVNNKELHVQRDDDGENISLLNSGFCEITGLYWLWKNLDADVYGLAHYRRYFKSADSSVLLKGEKVASSKEISEYLDTFDIVLPNKRNYWIESVKSHYANAHNVEDLNKLREVIEDSFPDYVRYFDDVMSGTKLCLFNMFAAKKEVFDGYCDWLFDLLFKLREKVDVAHYDQYQARVFGFLAERLLNVWVSANIDESKIKYLPVVNLEGENLFLKGFGLIKRKLKSVSRTQG